MSELRLYDTRRRAKVPVRVPTPGDPLTMYVCGPTVYGRAHIGNARPAVVFDVLARLIRHLHGPDSLRYARNITDIDDKIMAAATREGVGVDEIATRYERHYVDDMAALGVMPPDLSPHATHHVPGMIALIDVLIARGVAYAAEGHVLFSVAADPEYGSLSRRDVDSMRAGARVEVAPYKRDAGDFVLWKPSVEGQPGWDSPWGFGRPGWHLECSAMIRELLGETIDIHGGGQDLIFPHHENEAAQSRCANGAELARVWMHNGFLAMGADKMSKSLGNVVTVGELLEQGWDGEVLRLALLSAHYRQPLEWTKTLLDQCERRLALLSIAVKSFDEVPRRTPLIDTDFFEAISDDLNIPGALSKLNQLSDLLLRLYGQPELIGREMYRTEASNFLFVAGAIRDKLIYGFELLGIKLPYNKLTVKKDDIPVFLKEKIAARGFAKKSRDFATADRIRHELAAEGILLEDGPAGTTWRRA